MKKERFMDKDLIADIYERFIERYGYDQSGKFGDIEREFLETLSPKQKIIFQTSLRTFFLSKAIGFETYFFYICNGKSLGVAGKGMSRQNSLKKNIL